MHLPGRHGVALFALVGACSWLVACGPEPEFSDTGFQTDTDRDTSTDVRDAGAETGPDIRSDTDATRDADDVGDVTPDTRLELDVDPKCNPLSTSDTCLLPYPSSFHQDADESTPTGVTTQISSSALPQTSGGDTLGTDFVNTSDGASPAAPILMHFGFDIDLSNLPTQGNVAPSIEGDPPVVLIDMTAGERVPYFAEMDRNRPDDVTGRYAFIIRPVRPLEPGHRHAVAITDELTAADGAELESPPAFRALRENIPTTSDRIESARPGFEQLFSSLESRGFDREHLYLAWDFRVASRQWVLGPALTVRDEALAYADESPLDYNIEQIEEAPRDGTAKVVYGTFEVPSYIGDDDAIEWSDDREPQRQSEDGTYPFTMVIPEKVGTEGPLPLAIFGHGLFGSGRGYLTGGLADTVQGFAQRNGAVVVATDWTGLSDGDQSLIQSELLDSLNRIEVVTDRLLQSLVNHLVMTEIAQGPLNEDDRLTVDGNRPVDPTTTWYYGVSLGGIQGTSFVSLSPDVTRGVFSVGGGMWATMLSRSTNWNEFQPLLKTKYPDPLLRRVAIQLMQYYWDQVDPANIGRLLVREPLDGSPDRRILYHEAIGDTQVPNISTRALARAVGLHLVTPAVETPWGLPETEAPTTEPALTQYHLPNQTEGRRPPESNVPPEEDNGVHSDILFLDHLQHQIETFLETGEVAQYCDGACDPD